MDSLKRILKKMQIGQKERCNKCEFFKKHKNILNFMLLDLKLRLSGHNYRKTESDKTHIRRKRTGPIKWKTLKWYSSPSSKMPGLHVSKVSYQSFKA